jgi:hypothetical protein
MVVLVLATAPGWLFAGDSKISPEATQILEKSMAYLSGLQRFGLVTDMSMEVVLDTGQKIQFDNSAKAAVMRPDRFYAARLGDLVSQEFFYDGETLTLYDAGTGYYSTVDAPDTLEGMLDFARDSLDIVAPAGDLLYSNAYEILMEDVMSAFVVGESFIGGVVCDHLAFSKPGTDFQLWTARGEQPLPLKLVITSSDVVSAPQFTVLIREWDIEPGISQETFDFAQPEDAQAIEFITLDPTGN